jgi:hypothetical protein
LEEKMSLEELLQGVNLGKDEDAATYSGGIAYRTPSGAWFAYDSLRENLKNVKDQVGNQRRVYRALMLADRDADETVNDLPVLGASGGEVLVMPGPPERVIFATGTTVSSVTVSGVTANRIQVAGIDFGGSKGNWSPTRATETVRSPFVVYLDDAARDVAAEITKESTAESEWATAESQSAVAKTAHLADPADATKRNDYATAAQAEGKARKKRDTAKRLRVGRETVKALAKGASTDSDYEAISVLISALNLGFDPTTELRKNLQTLKVVVNPTVAGAVPLTQDEWKQYLTYELLEMYVRGEVPKDPFP